MHILHWAVLFVKSLSIPLYSQTPFFSLKGELESNFSVIFQSSWYRHIPYLLICPILSGKSSSDRWVFARFVIFHISLTAASFFFHCSTLFKFAEV